MATVFVGNLSERATAGLLAELFGHVGRVTRVHVPVDPLAGTARGYAFVDLQTDAMADYAIRVLAGVALHARKIVLRRATMPNRAGFSSSSLVRLRPATRPSTGALRAWRDGVLRALGNGSENGENGENGKSALWTTETTTETDDFATIFVDGRSAQRLSNQFFAGVETVCDVVVVG